MATLREIQNPRAPGRGPNIATPSALELSAIQQVVNNIRERFEKLEASVTQVRAVAQNAGSSAGSSTAVDLENLSAAVDDLAQRLEAIECAPATDAFARGQLANLTRRVKALEP